MMPWIAYIKRRISPLRARKIFKKILYQHDIHTLSTTCPQFVNHPPTGYQQKR